MGRKADNHRPQPGDILFFFLATIWTLFLRPKIQLGRKLPSTQYLNGQHFACEVGIGIYEVLITSGLLFMHKMIQEIISMPKADSGDPQNFMVNSCVFKDNDSETETKTNRGHWVCPLFVESPLLACHVSTHAHTPTFLLILGLINKHSIQILIFIYLIMLELSSKLIITLSQIYTWTYAYNCSYNYTLTHYFSQIHTFIPIHAHTMN